MRSEKEINGAIKFAVACKERILARVDHTALMSELLELAIEKERLAERIRWLTWVLSESNENVKSAATPPDEVPK